MTLSSLQLSSPALSQPLSIIQITLIWFSGNVSALIMQKDLITLHWKSVIFCCKAMKTLLFVPKCFKFLNYLMKFERVYKETSTSYVMKLFPVTNMENLQGLFRVYRVSDKLLQSLNLTYILPLQKLVFLIHEERIWSYLSASMICIVTEIAVALFPTAQKV